MDDETEDGCRGWPRGGFIAHVISNTNTDTKRRRDSPRPAGTGVSVSRLVYYDTTPLRMRMAPSIAVSWQAAGPRALAALCHLPALWRGTQPLAQGARPPLSSSTLGELQVCARCCRVADAAGNPKIFRCAVKERKKERKQRTQGASPGCEVTDCTPSAPSAREGCEEGTPPPHRDFKKRGVVR